MKRPTVYRPDLAFLLLSIFVFTSLIRCAHPVAPAGGLKDITPPSVVETDPPNYSVNFDERKIEIEFDEFIQLKDQAKEVFTSPPMVEKPELTIRGKKLIIELNEELKENLTYVINFGSAVVDIRESNPARGLSYVFSTGDAIDSLLIAGTILDAFDLTPVENVLFSVYKSDQDTIDPDSMFLKIPPLSAIRTMEDGSFQLTNLPGGEYMAYALEDLNSNFYYDLPNERIAFLDSLIVPEYIPMVPDTTEADSTEEISTGSFGTPQNHVTLYMFQEFDPFQRLLSYSLSDAGSIHLEFRLPVEELDLTPLNFPPDEDWMIYEYNRERDSLVIWPRDYERDTFKLELNLGDTLIDTLTFARKRAQAGGFLRSRSDKEDHIQFLLNTKSGVLPPGRELMLISSEPLIDYDFTGSLLYQPEDTVPVDLQIVDSMSTRAVIINEWEEDSRYGLFIPDSAMTGISGKSNDSIKVFFRTNLLEDYGSLEMSFLTGTSGFQYIVELMSDKDIPLKRDTITSDTIIDYLYLETGTYHFKAVIDKNENGKWDTGSLKHKDLPEHVFYFGKGISVRANWEMQEEWQLGN